MKKSASKGCGMMEKDETPAYEAKSHPASFLRKAARMAEKKSGGKRSSKKRS